MYNDVLLPVEERTATHSRINTAVSIAKQNNSYLHVLFVLDARVETGSSKQRFLTEFRERGKEKLNEISESVQGSLDITSAIEKGTFSKVVNDYQSNNCIDLTVVNNKYYGEIREYKTNRNSSNTSDYLIVGPKKDLK